MARGYLNGSGGNPNGSSDCTTIASDVLKGKTYIGADTNDEVGIGTLELTGNAEDRYVYSGKTYYNTNAKEKRTGSMMVSSVVSFSVAAYSTDQVIATWQWPSKGPYSGVAICAKTGGYPSNINDGRVYTGTGSSYALGSKSSVVISGLAVGTTYYFRIWTYCTVSGGDLYSSTRDATCATTARGQQTFTSSGTFTVPANVRSVQIFMVGGGGGGHGYKRDGTATHQGGGGGAGYTLTQKISVTPSQQISVVVGSGSSGNSKSRGGTSSFGSYFVRGGNGLKDVDELYTSAAIRGYPGGSGGGGGTSSGTTIASGGSDGGNGQQGVQTNSYQDRFGIAYGGQGQGTTTRAFGESSGTLYAGGGAGGASHQGNYGGGGGAGGGGGYGFAGTANTGGGGAGSGDSLDPYHAMAGGSGIVIVRWGY